MKRDDTKETTINVGIIRDRKEQTLSLTLPERKRSEMREESLDVPDMNAQVKSELDQARVHVAELRPDMMKYAEQIKRLKPEMEKKTSRKRYRKICGRRWRIYRKNCTISRRNIRNSSIKLAAEPIFKLQQLYPGLVALRTCGAMTIRFLPSCFAA
jgi:hypothetical protein